MRRLYRLPHDKLDWQAAATDPLHRLNAELATARDAGEAAFCTMASGCGESRSGRFRYGRRAWEAAENGTCFAAGFGPSAGWVARYCLGVTPVVSLKRRQKWAAST